MARSPSGLATIGAARAAAADLEVALVLPDPVAVSPREAAQEIPAGDWEASVLLALAPDRVREGRTAAWPRSSPRHPSPGLAGATYGWLTRDLSASGTLGDPSTAAAARGEARVGPLVEALAAVLEEIAGFEAAPAPP